MALKLIERLPLHLIQRYRPVGSVCLARLLSTRSVNQPSCVPCLRPSAGGFIRRHGCRKLLRDCGRRSVTVIVGEPSLVASSSVGSGPPFHLTQRHRPPTAEEQAFQQQLAGCSCSRQVLALLHSVSVMSDTMAAAALHRTADLEWVGESLKDPSVLETDPVRALCLQLEQDSRRLTDAGLLSALLACTRLHLDPWTTPMARLVSESLKRCDRGQMSVGQLCTLGQVMLAMDGPGCVMLEQVMRQIQKQEPAQWSQGDLVALCKCLHAGVVQDGKHQDPLNAVHTHTATITSHMSPSAVSGLLGALVTLKQRSLVPLVSILCKQAAHHVPRFTDEELAVVLRALMHFCHRDHNLVKALESYVPAVALTVHPETLTQVVQFVVQSNVLSATLFDAVAESFACRADDYSICQVTTQIQALGKFGYRPPNADKVFRKLETIIYTRLSHFRPRMLLHLLHSCILVERFPVNFVSKVFSSNFIQQLLKPGSNTNSYVLAQLTQLYVTMTLECPFYEGIGLHPMYRVKSFLVAPHYLETPVDARLHDSVRFGLVKLLGARSYFRSGALTPYYYTLDVEIKVNKEGRVLPARNKDDVHKRIALCIDGQTRFTKNGQLLGKEAIKQRHLRLLGYEVIQIPHYEFKKLRNRSITIVEYLRHKIFPHTYKPSWWEEE